MELSPFRGFREECQRPVLGLPGYHQFADPPQSYDGVPLSRGSAQTDLAIDMRLHDIRVPSDVLKDEEHSIPSSESSICATRRRHDHGTDSYVSPELNAKAIHKSQRCSDNRVAMGTGRHVGINAMHFGVPETDHAAAEKAGHDAQKRGRSDLPADQSRASARSGAMLLRDYDDDRMRSWERDPDTSNVRASSHEIDTAANEGGALSSHMADASNNQENMNSASDAKSSNILMSKQARAVAKQFILTQEQMRERNAVMFSPQLFELPGKSLGVFHEWDPFRISCAEMLLRPSAQLFFFALNIAHCVLIAIKPATRDAGFTEVSTLGDIVPRNYFIIENYYFVIEIVALLVLVLEITLAAVARGLLVGQYAFIQDPFNGEMCVCVCVRAWVYLHFVICTPDLGRVCIRGECMYLYIMHSHAYNHTYPHKAYMQHK
jgi:hypothetical protein